MFGHKLVNDFMFGALVLSGFGTVAGIGYIFYLAFADVWLETLVFVLQGIAVLLAIYFVGLLASRIFGNPFYKDQDKRGAGS